REERCRSAGLLSFCAAQVARSRAIRASAERQLRREPRFAQDRIRRDTVDRAPCGETGGVHLRPQVRTVPCPRPGRAPSSRARDPALVALTEGTTSRAPT